MIRLLPARLLRVRNLMLLSGLVICATAVLGAMFTRHALTSLSQRIVADNARQAVQNTLAADLKGALHELSSLTHDPEAYDALAPLNGRILDLWQEYQLQLDAELREEHRAYRQLDALMAQLANLRQTPPSRTAVNAYRRHVEEAFILLDTLGGEQARRQHQVNHDAALDLARHEQQLNWLSSSLAILVALMLWLVFHLLVRPLRDMGRIAQRIGRGEVPAETLSECEVHLDELLELRELMRQMVKDLTASHALIADNAHMLLGLTRIAADISSQVRKGVIEETAISKDIFEDLREMREGKSQMQQALSEALQIVNALRSGDQATPEQMVELRHHLLLIADISNSWKSLRDDMSRLLDGFDDMVRDRMTLANELEKLTKEMTTSAKEMALRAAR